MPIMPDLSLDPPEVAKTKPISVLLADDFAPFLYSLSELIGTLAGLELIGAARNGEELLALCRHTQPDVILMDIQMPIMDGVTATRQVKQQWPHTLVIGLTGFDELELNQDMLSVGASMCLSKTTSPSELLKHIIRVVNAASDLTAR